MNQKRDAKRLDGHRLTEFIYGTVVALVAIAGIDPAHAGWWSGVAVVVIGGVAIWLAHAYSTLMSHRITSGHRISGSDVSEALTSSWPIVSAALLTAVPILGVALSLYAMQTALLLASIVGVIILALVGAVAGIITQETWPRRLVLVLLSSGLGLLVVSIEVVIHH